MTTADGERSVLLVEGQDDKHAIYHLLQRHNVSCAEAPLARGRPIPEAPGSGKDALLNVIGLAVRSNTGRSAGFVFDANSRPTDRWRAVASRLRHVGVDVPDRIPADGFVGESREFSTRVGVWLMPDNRRTGSLEHFLTDLVDPDSRLLRYAQAATEEAEARGARFAAQDRQKALVHTWLAWQREPGLRYGTAIRAKYFRHDAPVAATFVDWYRRLYDEG